MNLFKDELFWNKFSSMNFQWFEEFVKTILSEYGTTRRCNRFDVGNCIEKCLAETIEQHGFLVVHSPDNCKVDLSISGYEKVSIKYSKSGNIKLINNLGQTKPLVKFATCIIIRAGQIYLISEHLLSLYGINYLDYIKYSGDGIILLGKIFTKLRKRKWKYVVPIDIMVHYCNNKQTYELVYSMIKYKIENNLSHPISDEKNDN